MLYSLFSNNFDNVSWKNLHVVIFFFLILFKILIVTTENKCLDLTSGVCVAINNHWLSPRDRNSKKPHVTGML